ncbi:Hypothetical protein ACI5QL_03012 [Bacillus velezensis]
MEEGRTMILMYEAPGLGAFLFSCKERHQRVRAFCQLGAAF